MEVIWIILLLIVAFAIRIFVPQLLVLRAIPKIIKGLRKYNATSPANARDPEDVGVRHLSWLNRMMKMKDYRPQALDLLISNGIINATEDQKVYIVLDKLMISRWRHL